MNDSLSYATLDKLPASVKRPGYDPHSRAVGIVHMGIGNFHRAHQAVFIDDLLGKTDGDWRIIAVSLRSPAMRDKMREQDYLYTLKEKDAGQEQLRVIGAIDSVLVAPENPSAVIDALASPNTYVVTITVTEKGYCLIPGSRELDLDNPDIQSDITRAAAPKTLIGFLLEASRVRRAKDLPGLNILSCDNLPDNAQLLKHGLLTAARLQDSELASWIETHLGFCSTMVDRIVPATTAQHVDSISQATGLSDAGALLSETFRQWVIEDNFVTRSPNWRLAGALVVDDVAPYEAMKLRLLNGSHSALAYMGHLLGFEFIHQAVAEPALKQFVSNLMRQDMVPTLANLQDVDLAQYCDSILARFANTAVPYRCQQVANDGSQKLPQRIIQPLSQARAAGKLAIGPATVIAAWLAYLARSCKQGEEFSINDSGAEKLLPMLTRQQLTAQFPSLEHTQALLTHSGLFSKTLLDDTALMTLIQTTFSRIYREGLATVLNEKVIG
ncbi:mannitol dehydrogenase family protein [Simiduia curdlanivorans]|uniref:Mannitol dehydrogenase family protein n=1 Tax=Simiduia curdlanivorans TaxID=1492769 RepID=A0ABV8V178_9GAMM|nr:mannitol dehydrogenase family protein [Simiduia curdlanivorans]MDN3637512.1 mannitol dehydrogenase family protein [Simiduia curdlanivorans]